MRRLAKALQKHRKPPALPSRPPPIVDHREYRQWREVRMTRPVDIGPLAFATRDLDNELPLNDDDAYVDMVAEGEQVAGPYPRLMRWTDPSESQRLRSRLTRLAEDPIYEDVLPALESRETSTLPEEEPARPHRRLMRLGEPPELHMPPPIDIGPLAFATSDLDDIDDTYTKMLPARPYRRLMRWADPKEPHMPRPRFTRSTGYPIYEDVLPPLESMETSTPPEEEKIYDTVVADLYGYQPQSRRII